MHPKDIVGHEMSKELSRPGRQPDDSPGRFSRSSPLVDAARVRELKAQGMGPTEIAKALKIGRASVYRVLEATA
jgi:DNA invertase Pin-like site-specific DNA recombinase